MKNGIRLTLVLVTLAAPVLGVDSLTPVSHAGDSEKLTPAAAAAVERHFPGATILGVEKEREAGVSYYEVTVRDGDEKIELEVTEDGTVGEIEYRIAWDDVPKDVQLTILEETGDAVPRDVERREVRGVPAGDTFKTIESPVVLYEVKYRADGGLREIAVTSGGLVLIEEDDDSDSDSDSDDNSSDDETES